MITIKQIRAARALLGWEQQELADQAGVSLTSLSRVERNAQHDARISTLEKIRKALVAAGIEFINKSDGATGVLIRPSTEAPGETKPPHS